MADNRLIWVVDDDPAIRELLSFIATEAGYEVDAFASGAEVLASSGEPPDAILLDLMMPEVSVDEQGRTITDFDGRVELGGWIGAETSSTVLLTALNCLSLGHMGWLSQCF